MKKWKRALALLLAALCLTGLLLRQPTPAAAVTQSDISALKDKASDIAAKKADLKKKIAALKSQSADALAQKELLDDQCDLIRAEISNAEDQISDYESLITQTQADLADARVEEQARYELFCTRVRAMEENGTVSYWSVLFKATSFTDLLSRLDAINEVMEYDQGVFNSLRQIRQEIEEKEAELQTDLADAKEQKKVLDDKKAELDAQMSEAADLIAQISESTAEYQKLLKAEEAEANSIDAKIKAAEAAMKNNGTSKPATYGGYIWPVSTSKYITSPYGTRTSPTSGRTEFHKGVDIAKVRYTSEVHAAKAGTVIISQYGSSYGNYVVISHGAGNTTLYAHMSKRLVSVGDTVAQGAAIGITGSTGNSTGPHLHFEITENGSRINPLSYLTDYIKGWK